MTRGTNNETPPRILVVDDSAAIHDDFRKILSATRPPTADELDALEAWLFGSRREQTANDDLQPVRSLSLAFEVDSALQGQEALEMVREALERGRPYSAIFVDVRMPPGWDGIETTQRIWKLDPTAQVVICSAYADYSWEEMAKALGVSERWVILKKPFDPVEVRQLAHSMARKWELWRENQQHVDQLEALVNERTAALSAAIERLKRETEERAHIEAELRRAHKLEALGRLTGGIGHEINNPLTFVITNLGFVTEALKRSGGRIDPESLEQMIEDLDHAQIGANRIKRIVRDMKLFSQGDETQTVAVDLREVLELAASMVSNQVKARAKLVRQLEQDVPPVMAVKGRLEQVFVNLLVNAVEALPEGHAKDNEVRLTLRAKKSSVIVEVQDTGDGISAQDIDRVFDPFFTCKEVGEGTGLGLSICHGIITSLDGEITLQSEPDKGTTVRVELPAARDVPKKKAQERTRSTDMPVLRTDGSPARALIVDDEPLVARALSRLMPKGYEVSVCHSGREALSALGQKAYDVVVCDLMMDDLTGIEVYERTRAECPALATRFVFITGGAYSRPAKRFIEAVSNPCLSKPISYAELADALEKVSVFKTGQDQ